MDKCIKHNLVPGQKFLRLTVIEPTIIYWMKKSKPTKVRAWRCTCDCGKETIVEISKIVSGKNTFLWMYPVRNNWQTIKYSE